MKTNDSKHVATFEKLLGFCNTFGAMYNPSKASIKVATMNTLLTSAQQSLEAVMVAQTAYTIAVNERQAVFNVLPRLGTRIHNALTVSDAPPLLIADVNTIRLRFRYPKRVKKRIQENDSADKPPSGTSRGPISHLDFESKIRNFSALIRMLASEPSYQPNEAELRLEALNTLLATLVEKDKPVAMAKLVLSNERLNRKRLLHDPSGIRGTALMVKRYIRSAFGATSDQVRQIKGLNFKKYAQK